MPRLRVSELGVALAARLEECERTGVTITDELLASIVKEERAKL